MINVRKHVFFFVFCFCWVIFLVFLISQIKLIKRTEKLELNLDIKVGRAVLSIISTSREGREIMEPLK